MIKIMKYGEAEGKELVKGLLSRSQLEYGDVQSKVDAILADIKANGDEALFKYTKSFDKFDVDADKLVVTKEEIADAYSKVDAELVEVIKRSAQRIRAFHEKQKLNSWLEPAPNGEMLGQLIRPLDRVGVYVPGGKAAYPSSVLMNIIPAKVAGVHEIAMTTPPNSEGKINPTTIVAADIAGVDKIYKAGGAQAIAALAYGTESIPKVDKIVGPGNIFVALAKRSVYGYVNIDSVAGPSEILILADDSANSEYVAADLLSQAEHDELASAVLITTSERLAKEVQLEVEKMTARLERKAIIEKSLDNYGAVIIVKDFDEATQLSNAIAPEHMEICTNNPFELLPKIQNAGAIFLGHYTPEPLGDYMAGPNHVLPTGGTARFFSPLSIDDYIKKSSLISFSDAALQRLGKDVIRFAEAEGLTAHANSVKVRMK
jgi:histidinol dehydrogenase